LGDGSALSKAKVQKLAKAKGISPAQIAIAWLLARSPVALPIPGTSSIAHLEENIAAAKVSLSKGEFDALA